MYTHYLLHRDRLLNLETRYKLLPSFEFSQNYLFLVNHDNNCYGASHYLYLLYNFLITKLTDIHILLCEVSINNTILQKYNIDIQNVIEYKNDPTLLYFLYHKINPKLIYFNSCNHSIYTIYSYIYYFFIQIIF